MLEEGRRTVSTFQKQESIVYFAVFLEYMPRFPCNRKKDRAIYLHLLFFPIKTIVADISSNDEPMTDAESRTALRLRR